MSFTSTAVKTTLFYYYRYYFTLWIQFHIRLINSPKHHHYAITWNQQKKHDITILCSILMKHKYSSIVITVNCTWLNCTWLNLFFFMMMMMMKCYLSDTLYPRNRKKENYTQWHQITKNNESTDISLRGLERREDKLASQGCVIMRVCPMTDPFWSDWYHPLHLVAGN